MTAVFRPSQSTELVLRQAVVSRTETGAAAKEEEEEDEEVVVVEV